MKWAEGMTIEPVGRDRRPQSEPLLPVLRELRARPGVWAELDRYPLDLMGSARSRGSQIRKRHEGIEYAVLPFGTEAVLYLRAVES